MPIEEKKVVKRTISSTKVQEVSKRVNETKLEIERLKSELQQLLDTNIKKPQTPLLQSPVKTSSTNLLLKNGTSTENIPKESNVPNPKFEAQVPKFESQSPKILSPSIKRKTIPPSNITVSTKEPSPKKVKHYDPQMARDYIKKQKELRKEQMKTDQKKMSDLELRKQRLKELHQKTLKLVSENVKKSARQSLNPKSVNGSDNLTKRSRSFSRDNLKSFRSIENLSNQNGSSTRRSRSVSRELFQSKPNPNPGAIKPQKDLKSQTKDSKPHNKQNSTAKSDFSKKPNPKRTSLNQIKSVDENSKSAQSYESQNGAQNVEKNQPANPKFAQNSQNDIPSPKKYEIFVPKVSNQISSPRRREPMVALENFYAVCERIKAATIIQAHYRGYRQRKKYKIALKARRKLKENEPTFVSNKGESPEWLKPPEILPYPFNFISAVKKKLSIATKSFETVNASTQMSERELSNETKGEMIKQEMPKGKMSKGEMLKGELSKLDMSNLKMSNLDLSNPDMSIPALTLKSPKNLKLQKVHLKPHSEIFVQKSSTEMTEISESASDSETFKNIPEISEESKDTTSKSQSLKRDMKELTKNINFQRCYEINEIDHNFDQIKLVPPKLQLELKKSQFESKKMRSQPKKLGVEHTSNYEINFDPKILESQLKKLSREQNSVMQVDFENESQLKKLVKEQNLGSEMNIDSKISGMQPKKLGIESHLRPELNSHSKREKTQPKNLPLDLNLGTKPSIESSEAKNLNYPSDIESILSKYSRSLQKSPRSICTESFASPHSNTEILTDSELKSSTQYLQIDRGSKKQNLTDTEIKTLSNSTTNVNELKKTTSLHELGAIRSSISSKKVPENIENAQESQSSNLRTIYESKKFLTDTETYLTKSDSKLDSKSDLKNLSSIEMKTSKSESSIHTNEKLRDKSKSSLVIEKNGNGQKSNGSVEVVEEIKINGENEEIGNENGNLNQNQNWEGVRNGNDIPRLIKPTVTLKTSKVSDENKKQSSNHQIHLKFEAELRLLNSFNSSLQQVIEVEKTLVDFDNKENETFQSNKSAVVQLELEKPKIQFIPDVLSPRKNSHENIQTQKINFSRGCDQTDFLQNSKLTEESFDFDNFEFELLKNTTMSTTINSLVSKIPDESAVAIRKNPYASVSLDMFDKMIQDEDARIEHLKAILKLREKALFDRTKSELAWLEIQKKQLKDSGQISELSVVKKKQRGLLIKYQQEKHEMQRLKKAHKTASLERKMELKEQKNLMKLQLTSAEIPTKFKRTPRTDRRQSGPLKVYSIHTKAEHIKSERATKNGSGIEEYLTITSSVISRTSEESDLESVKEIVPKSKVHMDKVKRALLMKEEALQKRRKEAEELLQWHQRLKEEEIKISQLEQAANSISQNIPQNESIKILTGAELNKFWKNITGISIKKFDDNKKFKMSQKELEQFFLDARKIFKEVSEDQSRLSPKRKTSFTDYVSDFEIASSIKTLDNVIDSVSSSLVTQNEQINSDSDLNLNSIKSNQNSNVKVDQICDIANLNIEEKQKTLLDLNRAISENLMKIIKSEIVKISDHDKPLSQKSNSLKALPSSEHEISSGVSSPRTDLASEVPTEINRESEIPTDKSEMGEYSVIPTEKSGVSEKGLPTVDSEIFEKLGESPIKSEIVTDKSEVPTEEFGFSEKSGVPTEKSDFSKKSDEPIDKSSGKSGFPTVNSEVSERLRESPKSEIFTEKSGVSEKSGLPTVELEISENFGESPEIVTEKSEIINGQSMVPTVQSDISENLGESPEIATEKSGLPTEKSEIISEKSMVPTVPSEISPKSHECPKSEIPTEKSELPTLKSEILSEKSGLLTEKSENISEKSMVPTIRSEISEKLGESLKSEIPTEKSELPTVKSEILSDKSGLPTEKSEKISEKSMVPTIRSEISEKSGKSLKSEIPTEKSRLPTVNSEVLSEKSGLPTEKYEIPTEKSELLTVSEISEKLGESPKISVEPTEKSVIPTESPSDKNSLETIPSETKISPTEGKTEKIDSGSGEISVVPTESLSKKSLEISSGVPIQSQKDSKTQEITTGVPTEIKSPESVVPTENVHSANESYISEKISFKDSFLDFVQSSQEKSVSVVPTDISRGQKKSPDQIVLSEKIPIDAVVPFGDKSPKKEEDNSDSELSRTSRDISDSIIPSEIKINQPLQSLESKLSLSEKSNVHSKSPKSESFENEFSIRNVEIKIFDPLSIPLEISINLNSKDSFFEDSDSKSKSEISSKSPILSERDHSSDISALKKLSNEKSPKSAQSEDKMDFSSKSGLQSVSSKSDIDEQIKAKSAQSDVLSVKSSAISLQKEKVQKSGLSLGSPISSIKSNLSDEIRTLSNQSVNLIDLSSPFKEKSPKMSNLSNDRSPKIEDQSPKSQDLILEIEDLSPKIEDLCHKIENLKIVEPSSQKSPKILKESPKIEESSKISRTSSQTKENSKISEKSSKIQESSKISTESPKSADTSLPKMEDLSPNIDDLNSQIEDSSLKSSENSKMEASSPNFEEISPKSSTGSPKEDQSPKSEILSSKKETSGPKIEESSPKIEDRSPKTQEASPKIEDRSPKTQEASPKIEDRSPKTQEASPKIEDRSPKTQEASPKIEDRSPKIEDHSHKENANQGKHASSPSSPKSEPLSSKSQKSSEPDLKMSHKEKPLKSKTLENQVSPKSSHREDPHLKNKILTKQISSDFEETLSNLSSKTKISEDTVMSVLKSPKSPNTNLSSKINPSPKIVSPKIESNNFKSSDRSSKSPRNNEDSYNSEFELDLDSNKTDSEEILPNMDLNLGDLISNSSSSLDTVKNSPESKSPSLREDYVRFESPENKSRDENSLRSLSPSPKSSPISENNHAGVSHIDVRKRVSEILDNSTGSSSRGDKSPRLQDFYVTTYDVISPSNSPETGSPTEEFEKKITNKSPRKSLYGDEAEELLRKQLEIEQEIKRLEAQQKENVPYCFMREIPNKPPPPYKPPPRSLIPTVKAIVPTEEKQVKTYIQKAATLLYEDYLNGKLNEKSHPNIGDRINSYRFIFNLCKEIALDLQKRVSEENTGPSWTHVKPRLRPLEFNKKITKESLESLTNRKVLQLLGFQSINRKDNLIVRWSRKKRDHVDEILVLEAQTEEADWTNYDRDEITVKNNLVNEILDQLLDETAQVMSEILLKKFRKNNS